MLYFCKKYRQFLISNLILYLNLMRTESKIVSACLFFSVMLCSCIHDEYKVNSLEDIDLTVSVGGEACTMPLGSTDTLRLSSLLKMEDGDFLKVDGDGNYHIIVEQEFSQEYHLSEFEDDMDLEGIEALFSKNVTIPAVLPVAAGEKVTVDLTEYLGSSANMTFELKSSFEEAKQHGLVRLDYLLMDNVKLSPMFECLADGVPLPEGIDVLLQLDVPERMEFSEYGAENTLLFSGTTDAAGDVSMIPVELERINYNVGPGDLFEFSDKFDIKSLVLKAHEDDLHVIAGKTVKFDLNIKVGNPDNDNRLMLSDFYGLIDTEMDAMNEELTLGNVPEFLKEDKVVLDFYAPELTAAIFTNVPVPVKINATLTPYLQNGSLGTEPVRLSFDVPFVTDGSEKVSKEYTWGKEEIGNLLKQIPDKIKVEIQPAVNTDVEHHHVKAGIPSYFVDGSFRFDVPFAFGDQIALSMTQEIDLSKAADILGQAVSNAAMVLKGDVTSSFPVAFEMSLKFLNASKEPLDIEISKVRLESCASDSEPVATPLNLSVAKSQHGTEISAMLVEFTMLPGTEPGIMIGDDSFIQANLLMEVQGGLTIDLGDLK